MFCTTVNPDPLLSLATSSEHDDDVSDLRLNSHSWVILHSDFWPKQSVKETSISEYITEILPLKPKDVWIRVAVSPLQACAYPCNNPTISPEQQHP